MYMLGLTESDILSPLNEVYSNGAAKMEEKSNDKSYEFA